MKTREKARENRTKRQTLKEKKCKTRVVRRQREKRREV